MKITSWALSALMVVSSAVVVVGAGTAPAQAAPLPTVSCGTTPSSGYAVTEVASGLDEPVGIAVDPTGNVFVSEKATGDLLKFAPSGAGYGSAVQLPGNFNGPLGVDVDDDTGAVWVTQASNNYVQRVVLNGSTYELDDDVISGVFSPASVAVDSTGAPYIGSVLDQKVQKFTPTSPGWTPSTVQSGGGQTWGLALGADDDVYTSYYSGQIKRATPSGGGWTDETIPTTGLSWPRGLDLGNGADGETLYVADSGNDRIVALSFSGGSWTQSALPVPGLENPTDVAAGGAGVVYVADHGNNRVLRLTPATIDAGNDTASTTAGDPVTTDVLANDTGAVPADPTIAKNPAHGTATVNDNGSVTYEPVAGFSGTDSYTYAVKDSTGGVCDTAKVTVTVTQGNSCDPLGTTGATVRLPIETGTDYPVFFDVDADGNIFVTDSETDEIVKLTPSASGYDRSVVATGLANPTSIKVGEDGVLYVALYSGSAILKLTPSGSTYATTTIASGGSIDRPAGIDIDSAGDLFISNSPPGISTGTVVRLDASSGYSQEVVTTGLAFPHQVAVDDSGDVFVATYNTVVKLVNTGSGYTKENVVTGLSSGNGVAIDSTGTLWVSDSGAPNLLRLTPSGSGYTQEVYAPWGANDAYTVVVGADDSLFVSAFNRLMTIRPATLKAVDDTATVTAPQTVTTDVRANDRTNTLLYGPTVIDDPEHGTVTENSDDTISYTPDAGYAGTDSYTYRVRGAAGASTCSVATVTVTVEGATGCQLLPSTKDLFRIPGTTDLSDPAGIAADASNIIYISDAGAGEVIGWGPGSGPAMIDSAAGIDPQGIAVDADRNVYYADEGEHEIVKLTWTGSSYTRSVLDSNLQRPSGVAVDSDGNVYYAENSSGHVHKLTPSGAGYTKSLVGSGYESPRGVAVDADGNVFVADSQNDRIVKLSPSGSSYTQTVVSLSVHSPYGVAVGADGTVIVGDYGYSRVVRLVPDVGSGYRQETVTVWGDHAPTWVAVTAIGAILVVDEDTAEVVIIGSGGVTAANDSATTTAPAAVTTDVRANDTSSPAGGTLSNPTIASTPQNGSAAVNADGTITYTPDAGFSGTDSYTYTVTDANEPANVCDVARVNVTVTSQGSTRPNLTVTAPDQVTMTLDRAGSTQPVRLNATVRISGLRATRAAAAASTGTATLYGPAAKPSASMCTPANKVATVRFDPANGTLRTPAVAVTRPGHYTWVVSTGAVAGSSPASNVCGSASATTLVHRPWVGTVRVEAGYSGIYSSFVDRVARIARPRTVSVPALGMTAPLRAVGVRRGAMQLPGKIATGGWLRGSAAPGEAVGATVIAGHVSNRRDRPGAFGKLRKARVGQIVKVTSADGKVRSYRIVRITSQNRKKGISGAATSTTGAHRLTLVTCTGKVTYRNGHFHYTKNLVVTAVPLA